MTIQKNNIAGDNDLAHMDIIRRAITKNLDRFFSENPDTVIFDNIRSAAGNPTTLLLDYQNPAEEIKTLEILHPPHIYSADTTYALKTILFQKFNKTLSPALHKDHQITSASEWVIKDPVKARATQKLMENMDPILQQVNDINNPEIDPSGINSFAVIFEKADGRKEKHRIKMPLSLDFNEAIDILNKLLAGKKPIFVTNNIVYSLTPIKKEDTKQYSSLDIATQDLKHKLKTFLNDNNGIKILGILPIDNPNELVLSYKNEKGKKEKFRLELLPHKPTVETDYWADLTQKLIKKSKPDIKNDLRIPAAADNTQYSNFEAVTQNFNHQLKTFLNENREIKIFRVLSTNNPNEFAISYLNRKGINQHILNLLPQKFPQTADFWITYLEKQINKLALDRSPTPAPAPIADTLPTPAPIQISASPEIIAEISQGIERLLRSIKNGNIYHVKAENDDIFIYYNNPTNNNKTENRFRITLNTTCPENCDLAAVTTNILNYNFDRLIVKRPKDIIPFIETNSPQTVQTVVATQAIPPVTKPANIDAPARLITEPSYLEYVAFDARKNPQKNMAYSIQEGTKVGSGPTGSTWLHIIVKDTAQDRIFSHSKLIVKNLDLLGTKLAARAIFKFLKEDNLITIPSGPEKG